MVYYNNLSNDKGLLWHNLDLFEFSMFKAD